MEAKMPTSKISKRGQSVIPKAIRDHLDLEPGDIVKDKGDIIIRPAIRDVRDLKGLLLRLGQPAVSVDEMNRVIMEQNKEIS